VLKLACRINSTSPCITPRHEPLAVLLLLLLQYQPTPSAGHCGKS
jgi:hypothetical protein